MLLGQVKEAMADRRGRAKRLDYVEDKVDNDRRDMSERRTASAVPPWRKMVRVTDHGLEPKSHMWQELDADNKRP